MCGINGFNFKDQKLIDRMNEVTKHRGPDGVGVFLDDQISLGHNLLAIVDTPDHSRQPFVSPDKNFALVYNGEIYNYQDLRHGLEQGGAFFHTNSDSEVLFEGLMREGVEFIQKLDGMFAFAFYDRTKERLLLARDRSGIKPLYYHFKNGRFIFSSEIKGILEHVKPILNNEGAKLYFTYGYVPGQRTMFQGIQKVNPGEYLMLKNGQLSSHWFAAGQVSKGIAQAEKTRDLIGASVRRHTMGLRPFGLYLSGGLDSTVLLHELSQFDKDLIKTYTTRFETKDSELNEDADYAKRLAGEYRIDHHELTISEQQFIEALPKTIRTLEEPRYNFSVPAYWLLAELASKDITVILNGSGGDELFLGYERYLDSQSLSKLFERYPAWLVDAKATGGFLKRGKISFGHFLRLERVLDRWTYFSAIMPYLNPAVFNGKSFDLINATAMMRGQRPEVMEPAEDPENTLANLDRLFWLADEEFMRPDKIAMHFGMEGRFPLLANEIIDYARSIPSLEKIKNGTTKYIIRSAYQGRLPDYITEKRKTGWYAPVVEWMDSSLGEMVRETLRPEFYSPTAGLFKFEELQQYLKPGNRFTRGNIKRFWSIFTFQIWAKEFNIQLK